MDERSMRIKRLFEESGLTYLELEKKIGIKKSSLQRYASGATSKIPISAVEKIAEAFHVSSAYIMGWEEQIEAKPEKMAQRHFEILMDEDISDIFEDFKTLDATKRKIVKDLVHSLAEKKTEV